MGLVGGTVGDERDTDDETWRSQKHAVARALKARRTSLAEEMFNVRKSLEVMSNLCRLYGSILLDPARSG